MTKLNQQVQGHMESHVFTCYCGEDSYLQISRDDEDGQYYISITKHPTRLGERLKTAWQALKGLEFTASNEVIIDGADAASLVEALRPIDRSFAANPEE